MSTPRLLVPLATLALVPGLALAGEVPWAGPVTIGTGAAPTNVRVADMDQDHDLDVVVAYGNTDGLVVYSNDTGATSFTAATVFGAATNLDGLHIQDVTLDAHPDVLVGVDGSDSYAVLSNDGAGTYTQISSGIGSVAQTAFDADKDGDLDLYSLSWNQASGFEGMYQKGATAHGAWSGVNLIAIAADETWTDIETAEIDNDGELDILLCRDGGVFAHTNNRGDTTDFNGDWSAPITVSTLDGATEILVADFDRNGFVDVIVGTNGGAGAALVMVPDDGAAAWGSSETIDNTGASDVLDLDAVDIDYDGDLDLLVARASGVYLYESIDYATSWVEHTVTTSIVNVSSARFADLDDDGDYDIVAASSSEGSVSWIENQMVHATYSFSGSETTFMAGPSGSPVGPVLTDLDLDGDLDVLGFWSDGSSGTTHYSLNILGDGSSWSSPIQIGNSINSANWQEHADFDGDGDDDQLVIGNFSPSQVRWYPNEVRDGTDFGTVVSIQNSSTSWGGDVGDLDADGDIDIIRSQNTGGTALANLNNGDGSSWTNCTFYNGPDRTRGGDMVDLDQDGLQDIVITQGNGLNNGLLWFRQTGGSGCATTFQQIALTPPGTFQNPGSVNYLDLDEDGLLDVVFTEGDTFGLLNPGSPTDIAGNWPQTVISSTGYGSNVPVDADHDGDEDLIARSGSDTYFIENLIFGASWDETTSVSGTGSGTDVADIDGDGVLDILYIDNAGYGWRQGILQQAAASTADSSPALGIMETESDTVLTVTLDHTYGRTEDVDLELGTLELFLHDGSGAALTDSEAATLFGALEVWRDVDGDGAAGGGSDVLVDAINSYTLSTGLLTWDLPSGVAGAGVAAATTGDYVVVAEIANGAFAAGLTSFGIDHVAGTGVLIDHFGGDVVVVRDGTPAGISGVDVDVLELDSDADGDPDSSDCADNDPLVYTGATELCNLVDDDCDTTVDDGFDVDGDGAFDGSDAGCVTTYGAAVDCDDSVGTTFPGATETCNAVDDDCDTTTDEGFDGDSDNVNSCGPDGIIGNADDDCDDSEATTFPGATESCDFVDSDCDGDLVDEFLNTDVDLLPDCVDTDDDDDGDLDSSDCNDTDPSIYNGAPEVCDAVDSNCNGSLVDSFTDTDTDQLPDCIDTDDDDDGLPDTWENDNGLDPLDATDAASDADGDGRSAAVEYADGTDPNLYQGPTAPTNLSPEEGVFVTDAAPTLEVGNATHPLGDAMSYTFEIYSDAALTTLVVSESGIAQGVPTTTWTSTQDLIDDTDYWFRAAASDAFVMGGWSTESSFRIDTSGESPNTPTLEFPLLGQTMETGEEELIVVDSVSPEGLSIEYTFELYNGVGDTLLSSADVDGGTDGAETAWLIDIALNAGDLYAWRAKATDPAGRASQWTPLEVFGYLNANIDPGAPAFLSPEDGGDVGTVSPELVIDESTDPEESLVLHTISLDTADTFATDDLIEFSVLGDLSGTLRVDLSTLHETHPEVDAPIELTPNITWYARVYGEDANGQVSTPDVVGFLVRGDNDPPGVPELIGPAEKMVTDSNPELTATDVTDPEGDVVSYQFQVSTELTFGALVVDDVASEPRYGVTEDLAGGYWWRVRAVDALGGSSAWSEVRYFVAEDPSWGSCSTGGGSASAWAILLLGLGLFVRRRA